MTLSLYHTWGSHKRRWCGDPNSKWQLRPSVALPEVTCHSAEHRAPVLLHSRCFCDTRKNMFQLNFFFPPSLNYFYLLYLFKSFCFSPSWFFIGLFFFPSSAICCAHNTPSQSVHSEYHLILARTRTTEWQGPWLSAALPWKGTCYKCFSDSLSLTQHTDICYQ